MSTQPRTTGAARRIVATLAETPPTRVLHFDTAGEVVASRPVGVDAPPTREGEIAAFAGTLGHPPIRARDMQAMLIAATAEQATVDAQAAAGAALIEAKLAAASARDHTAAAARRAQRAVRVALSAGLSAEAIGDILGVSRARVYQIRDGRR